MKLQEIEQIQNTLKDLSHDPKHATFIEMINKVVDSIVQQKQAALNESGTRFNLNPAQAQFPVMVFHAFDEYLFDLWHSEYSESASVGKSITKIKQELDVLYNEMLTYQNEMKEQQTTQQTELQERISERPPFSAYGTNISRDL